MLAIIGGTGLYDFPGMEMEAQVDLDTSFGAPSVAIIKGRLAGQTSLFFGGPWCRSPAAAA